MKLIYCTTCNAFYKHTSVPGGCRLVTKLERAYLKLTTKNAREYRPDRHTSWSHSVEASVKAATNQFVKQLEQSLYKDES